MPPLGYQRQTDSLNIKDGRGAALTIDLTNRCNMMCTPCVMDANQVGYVHELTLDEVKRILDASISFKPRRQLSVQFSGGEPTIHTDFLESVCYAKQLGYWYVQAATDGLRFAQDPVLAFRAAEAGLDMVYLQFDGVTNEANQHRWVTNLFDAKLLCIENCAKADIGVTSGPIGAVSFQPVSFTGGDEDIRDEDRRKGRYTISHLAWDLHHWSGAKIDAHRDRYPLGAGTLFASLADHLRGPKTFYGGFACSCHPNCGSSVHVVFNVRTRAWAAFTDFFDLDQFMDDVVVMTDTARDPKLINVQLAMSVLRNFKPERAPAGFQLSDMARLLDRRMGGSIGGDGRPDEEDWRIMWVGGMWFQDLWTYDFRRTEMCVIPYVTQEGEISFCAYNTGIGRRSIIENMHMTATTAEWFRTRGRHPIYAGNGPMPLPEAQHSLRVRANDRERCGNGCGCGSRTERQIEKTIQNIVAAPSPAPAVGNRNRGVKAGEGAGAAHEPGSQPDRRAAG